LRAILGLYAQSETYGTTSPFLPDQQASQGRHERIPKEDGVFQQSLSLAGYDSTALVIVVDDCLDEIVCSAVRHKHPNICGLLLADFKHK